ncbi:hypothetical protein [Saccharothrix sp. NRRL B-16348]|uniref:hypothetical protein n=1 Tax=Saccharothrix sp. NRRL B-16348 TaxID=1415542 RepID=UPI0018D18FAF|nr:hypothetical protein [Saccharothrix sp. NRRL B-16348]
MSNRLDGIVHGPAAQAGQIDVMHIHASTASAAPIPWQLPPAPRAFTDRQDDRERLNHVLTGTRGDDADGGMAAGPVVIGLYGPTGIGKSALAVRWLHEQHDRLPDGQLHARFDTGGPVDAPDPDSVVSGFLLALGIAQYALPAEPDQGVALYRPPTVDRVLAVLLDDIGDAGEVAPSLPSGSGRWRL